MRHDWPRRTCALAVLALALGAAGCPPQGPRAPAPDCLTGPQAGTPACESLDDDPERCAIEGGIYDAGTQRCIR